MERRVKHGVILLGLGSFALSYEQLHAVALIAGIPWYLALVYGALTEGFISIATLAAWVTRGTRQTVYPWCVAGMAFGYSLWANSSPASVPPGVARAVPVVALPLAVHLYIVIEHRAPRLSAPVPAAFMVADEPQSIEAAQPETMPEVTPQAAPEPIRDIDPATVENPELVAARLMVHAAKTPSARSYYERRVRELTPATANA